MRPDRLIGGLGLLLLFSAGALITLNLFFALALLVSATICAIWHTVRTFASTSQDLPFKAPVFVTALFLFIGGAAAMAHWMTLNPILEWGLINAVLMALVYTWHQPVHTKSFYEHLVGTVILTLFLFFPSLTINIFEGPISQSNWALFAKFAVWVAGTNLILFTIRNMKHSGNSFGLFFLPVFLFCLMVFAIGGFALLNSQTLICALALGTFCLSQSKPGYHALFTWLLKNPKHDLNPFDVQEDITHSLFHLCNAQKFQLENAEIILVSHSKLPFYTFNIIWKSHQPIHKYAADIRVIIDGFAKTLDQHHKNVLTLSSGTAAMSLNLTPKSAHQGLIWMQKAPIFPYEHAP